MSKPGYWTADYRRAQQWLRDDPQHCVHCGAFPALSPDHDPPLSTFEDRRAWTGVFLPSCLSCARKQGGRMAAKRERARWDRLKGYPLPSRAW